MSQQQGHMWGSPDPQSVPAQTAASTQHGQHLAQQQSQAIAAVTDTFGGQGVQLPTDAALPTLEIMRESQQFRSDNGQLVTEVDGHIIHWHEACVYWSRPFGEGDGGRPDCSSSDGIQPDGGEAPLPGPCRSCPMNQYESAPDGGRGKACQNMIRGYFLRDGYRVPEIFKASPASLSKKESLVPWLVNSVNEGVGGKYQTIHVRLNLYKKDFDKFSASVLRVTTLGVLDPHRDAEKLQQLGMLYQQVTQYHLARGRTDVQATDRSTGETFDPNNPPKDGIPV